MIKLLLFCLLFILVGSLILIAAFSAKKKLQYDRDVVNGFRPKEQSEEEEERKKTKQQIELELLLINNSVILKFLALVDRNIKVKLSLILLLFSIFYLFNPNSSSMDFIIAGLVIFIVFTLLPSMLSSSILNSKIKRIMSDLPNFIDLVAVSIQTGNGIDAGLRQVAKDFKALNPDLTHVMLRIMRRAELSGLESALQDLAIAIPTKEIRMFCTVLIQSLNFGSSVYNQLIILSADIREIQLLIIEEKLGTLAAKMSVPLILFIMFPIVFLILAPGAMRVLPNVL
ncbi:type II secretion system F family protein [Gallibacterium genomosp. 3]|uniref:Pilus assembly protein TadC n=1 Tax=Gallibacterium genomosp. 3 TaxID=505345 RepID=A0A1A7QC90_9PAST|nr:type II secretion system F family protein [Gallibacterium genomosp. 3]OBX11794.1 pilus assembly protein TadC [Gallibacterium genomosp. 3]